MLQKRKKDADSLTSLEIGDNAQRLKSKCVCAKSLRGFSVIAFVSLVIFVAYRYHHVYIADPNPTNSVAAGDGVDSSEEFGSPMTKAAHKADYLPSILKKWKAFATQSAPRKTVSGKGCMGKYLRMYGAGVGESTNHLLTLANGLAVADSLAQYMNFPQHGQDHSSVLYTSDHELHFLREKTSLKAARYTLLVPAYITKDLQPFTLKSLQELYCVEFLADGGADDIATKEFLDRHAKKKEALQKLAGQSEGWLTKIFKSVLGTFSEAESPIVKHGSITQIASPPLNQGDVLISASNLFYWGKEVSGTVDSELERVMSATMNPHIAPDTSLRASGKRRLAAKKGKSKPKGKGKGKGGGGKGKGKGKGKGGQNSENWDDDGSPDERDSKPATPPNNQAQAAKQPQAQAAAKPADKKQHKGKTVGASAAAAAADDDNSVETDDVVGQKMDDDRTDDSFEDDDRDNKYWFDKARTQKAIHRGFTRGSDFLFVVDDDLSTFKHEERISNGEYVMLESKTNKKDKQPNLRIVDPGYFARYTAGVLAALWTDISEHYQKLALSMVRAHYGGRFSYSAVHKRAFEGTCSAEYAEKTFLQRDFQALIAYDEKVKKITTDMRAPHPVCTMSPSWVIPMIRRKQHVSRMYIASDGQADDSEWEAEAARKHVKGQEGIVIGRQDPLFESGAGGGVFDMFNAVLAEGLFLGNPRSTYSLAIFTLRSILTDRINIPLAMDFDMYFNIHVEKGWKSKLMNDKKTIVKPKMEVFGSIPGKTWVTRRMILNMIEDITGLYQRRL